jgi:hypothetical protein
MKINLIYMTDHRLYLNYINDHYNELKFKYYNFCKLQHYDWDEDVFSDTILKCYESIEKKGKLNDTTPYGMESYTFLAFKNNIRNEKRYCRNKNRDNNISSDNINDLYEDFYNKSNDSATVKIQNDLFKDYAILYIMLKVEEHFDLEHVYLFKVKTLTSGMTFKKLAETCKNIKATRKKILEVQHWIKENVSKEDIRKSFFEQFGDLIGN